MNPSPPNLTEIATFRLSNSEVCREERSPCELKGPGSQGLLSLLSCTGEINGDSSISVLGVPKK